MRGLFLVLLTVAGLTAASPSLALELTSPGSVFLPRAALLTQRAGGGLFSPSAGFGAYRLSPFTPTGSRFTGWTGASNPLERVRLEYSRENFYTGEAGGKLGQGQGFAFNQDLVGAKLAFLGTERSRFLPQLAVGLQYRRTEPLALFSVLGPKKRKDYYASATKLFFGKTVMISGAVRSTKISRQGFYGLTPTRNMRRRQFEASVAWTPTDRLAIGLEHRTSLGSAAIAQHADWNDAFVSYAFNRHLSLNAALVDRSRPAGPMANAFGAAGQFGGVGGRRDERGAFLTLQAGF